MVKSLIRIRKNPDERLSYIANRWKMEKEFAASSWDTMLKAFTVAAILFVFARRKSKAAFSIAVLHDTSLARSKKFDGCADVCFNGDLADWGKASYSSGLKSSIP